MIPYRQVTILFCLGLALSFIFSGCVSTTTENVETTVEPPPVEVATEYPGGIYEAGDELYPGGYYIHTVELADESISIIAKWFTGDLMNWEVLAKCNPTLNPNRIFLGDKIRIPRSIMTRQDPMTAEFVQESQPQTKRKPKPVVTPPAVVTKPANKQTAPDTMEQEPPKTEEEPLLFGPKGYTKD